MSKGDIVITTFTSLIILIGIAGWIKEFIRRIKQHRHFVLLCKNVLVIAVGIACIGFAIFLTVLLFMNNLGISG